MFTGIIEAVSQVISCQKGRMTVERPKIFKEIVPGQSVSVNGACLSLVEYSKNAMGFDVVPETFTRTNLGRAEKVNLERALRADGRFEGHIVTGHIEGRTKLLKRENVALGEWFTFSLPREFSGFIVEKGSITLNGISLTIGELKSGEFSVAIIPHTLQMTNFAFLRSGEEVNVELDILAKYCLELLSRRTGKNVVSEPKI